MHWRILIFTDQNRINHMETIVYKMNKEIKENDIYIKRDDLLPFSFGGNKARKAMYFFEDIKAKNADYIGTYGSSSSNHCRVVANLAASHNLPCFIVSPEEESDPTFNSRIVEKLGAKVIRTPLSEVSKTIDDKIKSLKNEGYNPYFILGGGHGNLGTQAYVDCYNEILDYELRNNINFDYIFCASGTGTTQAGLICGKLIHKRDIKIVGISVARDKNRGSNVIKQSIDDYFNDMKLTISYDEKEIIFDDSYRCGGYGKYNSQIKKVIDDVFKFDGIALNTTYVGKAFWGMKDYLTKNKIKNKKVLFIHTGGTPLFFNDLEDK